MHIELKYPIFTFGKNDKMIYVFHRDKDNKTTNTDIFKKSGYPGSTIIDSSGMKYVIKKAYKTKWRGIGGYFTGMQGRVFLVDFEYEDEGAKISLNELKSIILSRYPKSHWFHEGWADLEEFEEEIAKCSTFEELARLIGGPPPSSNFFLRMIKGY